MRPDIAPRLLALPADIRALLAGVEGPGWRVIPAPDSRHILVVQHGPYGIRYDRGEVWWPANPAAAVAAVLKCPIYTAHYRLYQADATGDDHAAALAVIEAHVASRSPA